MAIENAFDKEMLTRLFNKAAWEEGRKNKISSQELFELCVEALRAGGVEKPVFETRVLLSHLFGAAPHELMVKPLFAGGAQVDAVQDFIERKVRGEPTAYIVKKKEFYSREFFVDPGVLIPRPETEELAEWAIEKGPYEEALDLCCGSGALGLTLLLEGAARRALLSDVSEGALEAAQKNIERFHLGERAELAAGDLFDAVGGSFDVIVSNPPYVLPDEYEELDPCVRDFEPKIALLLEDVDVFNRRLAEGAMGALKAGGAIFIETSPAVMGNLEKNFRGAGFSQIEKKTDLSGKLRFLGASSK